MAWGRRVVECIAAESCATSAGSGGESGAERRLMMWLLVAAALLACAGAALIPEPEVHIQVLEKPFLCKRKTRSGDMLLVHSDGFLQDNGTRFYSTYVENNGQPVWFTLGIREVIKGWDKGLQDMCVGEKRKITVPPALAYGKEGKGKIPPDSTLIFNISLMDIRNGPRSHESFQEMDLNDDWKLSKEEVRAYLKAEFMKHGNPVNESHHDVLVSSIFEKEDEDSDGYISAREFTYIHDEL
ncbi:peptidyl-prolyl cis-trans isomerase FKBP14 [Ranitomeya imitator]|uniref:peptidyl-prolyl cis-trans isomerase FKBP14 n=1 Tax=Ranitomeya imitator TaxID=111125 RepID=UPI001AA80F19